MAQLSLRENEDEPVPAPVLPLNEREIKIEAPSMWTRPQIRYRPLRSDKALLDECPLVLRPEALLPSPRYKKGGTPNFASILQPNLMHVFSAFAQRQNAFELFVLVWLQNNARPLSRNFEHTDTILAS